MNKNAWKKVSIEMVAMQDQREKMGYYNIYRRRSLTIAIGLTMLVIIAAGVAAGTDVSSCMTISSPGEYMLTTNISDAATCIKITSSNVTFDGAGYTIDGTRTGGTYGVYVNDPSITLTNVIVKNLTATDWETGINYENTQNGSIVGINASSNINYGIQLSSSSNNNLIDNTADSNSIGIFLNWGSSNNKVTGNNANSSNGIYVYSENNLIYDNRFNGSYNYFIGYLNTLNTSKQPGENIIGGLSLGGNFWGKPDGTGFSDICGDADSDGICDSQYDLGSGIIDYLPLTTTGQGIINPEIDSCTLISVPGTYVLNQSILDSDNPTCIRITANNVSFDGAGYTVDGVNNGGSMGISVHNQYSQLTNVTVKNFTVTGWGTGINYENTQNGSIVGNNASSNSNYGIYLGSSGNNNLTGNTIYSNSYGIFLNGGSNNNIVTRNKANSSGGIYVYSENNLIYNNRFNSSYNYFYSGFSNTLNTSKQSGENINGGSYLGGNFWSKPDGTGFSDICGDADSDGICDSQYDLGSGIIDYLPLTTTGQGIINPEIDSCTLISLPGNYVLNHSIVDNENSTCIKIIANNVSLDGAGHTVDGIDASGSKGVYVNNQYSQLTNVTIKNLTATGWETGINYENTQNGSIVGINASSNYYGIQLSSSSNINLTNNTVDSNINGFGIYLYSGSNNNITGNNVKSYYGIRVYYSANNLIYNNRFNSTNNEIYWYSNTLNTSKQLGKNIIGGSYLGGNFWANPDGTGFSETCEDANSDGICDSQYDLGSGSIDYFPLTKIGLVVQNQEIDNCTLISVPGTYVLNQSILDSDNPTCIRITANNVSFDGAGYTVDGVNNGGSMGISVHNQYSQLTNVTVKNFTVTGWGTGINYEKAHNGSIVGNNASSNSNYGIYLGSSGNNNLTGNTIYSNSYGILLNGGSNNNIVTGNNANSSGGIYVYSENNLIYNNRFNSSYNYFYSGFSNTLNTSKQSGENINGGSYLGGNFWSKPDGTGFSDICGDADSDGICDSQYDLGSGIIDHLPLTTTGQGIINPEIDRCTLISLPGNYVLNHSIVDSENSTCIKIIANNVSLDGAGHTVDGIDASGSKGVYVNNQYSQLTNVTIKNLTVTGWGTGINYENTQNGSIAGINASSNDYGIQLSSSSYNNLIDNTADSNNGYGIYLYSGSNNNVTGNNVKSYYGILVYYSVNNLIYNNRFNSTSNDIYWYSNTLSTSKQPGKNIIGGSYLGGNFWANPDGTGFSETCEDADSDGICDSQYDLGSGSIDYFPLTKIGLVSIGQEIDNCTLISVPGSYVLNQSIIDSNNPTCIEITANNVSFDGGGHTVDGIDTGKGIYVYNQFSQLTNVTIKNLIVTDWETGIYYENTHNGSIVGNNASSNYNYGIYLYSSSNNNLADNIADSNGYGIFLNGGSNNIITRNKANKSSSYGIYVSSNNNWIYNNKFNSSSNYIASSNTLNITKTIGTNIIMGPYLGGNFWAKPDRTGFSEICGDADSDGICDLQYNLGSGVIDYYPLTTTGHGIINPEIDNCTLISLPGTYVLNQSIVDSNNPTCIRITANNVSLDGAGHTVDGIDAGSSNGVYVNNPYSQLTNVTIKNLTATDWGTGINYENAQNGSIVGNNANSNSNYGIYLYSSSNTNLTDNTADSNGYGIFLNGGSNNNNITGNNANSSSGIYVYSERNLIYNNRFNSSSNYFYSVFSNTLNTSIQPGKNIIGGSYLGGNFWANPDGTGFSQKCVDSDRDGICDLNYSVDSNNIDFLPLSMSLITESVAPSGVTDLTNISYAQTYINWTWSDPADPDFDYVEIYLDGIFKKNALRGEQYYNATSLSPDMVYNLSTRTVDTSGNINATEVYDLSRTAPAGIAKVDTADLVITDLTWTPSTFSDGQTVTFRASINNIDTINTTGGFYTRFLIDEVQIGEKYIPGLDPGSTTDIVQVWPASPGTHTIKVITDYYNNVAESNESNNTVSIILPDVPSSDLKVSALSWNPATFSDGQGVTLNMTIRNIGSGNTTRQFYAQFKIGGGCELNILVSDLAAGESRDVSVVWVASSGDHNLTATADPDGFITESNKDNNNMSANLPPVLASDLIITGIDWSPGNPSDGDIVSFKVTVSNTGAGNTSRNSGIQLDIDDVYFQRTLIEGLDAGKSITIDIPKKWNANFGEHSIRAIADSTYSIKEENETNNNFSVNLNIDDRLPPVLSVMTPANGSIISIASNVTVLLSDGTGSGINLVASGIEVKKDALTIAGVKSIDSNKLVFTPTSGFSDGDYNVSISAFDISGTNRIIAASFIMDTTAPVISISNVSEGASYNIPVIPDVTITDQHPLATSITMNDQPFIPGTAITTDGIYHILVEASDMAGNKARSAINFIVDGKPAAPTGFRISRDVTTADLLWNPNIEADIAGYNIYRNGLKLNSVLIPDNEYRDTNLTPTDNYLYNITAVDAAGHESDMAGLSPIRITLDGYGTLDEGGYYLTRGFADAVNFSIINEGNSTLNAKSITLEVLDSVGNSTYTVSDGPFMIKSRGECKSGKVILTGGQTDRLAVKVLLEDDTQMSRIFYVNVRNAPGQPVEIIAPTIIEGYRDLIDIKFTNFGSASMGIDPQKVPIFLRDANGTIISQGRGEGAITWIRPNSTGKIRAFINTPVAEGDIELIKLSINTTISTLYDNMKNGTAFKISENLNSKYQTIKPIDIYHGPIIKGSVTQFDAVFNNQGTDDLTVDNGAVTINIKNLNGSIISSGNYIGSTLLAIHDGSQKFQISVVIPSDAPDIVAVEAVLYAGYWTPDESAVPIRFNLTSLMSTVQPDYNADAITNKAIYDRAENVTISGHARYNNGTIVANVPVLLKISNKGFERKELVNTDTAGEYNYTFQPLENEAGKYIVSATHPSVNDLEPDAEFAILGLYIDPINIILTMSKNSERTFPVEVKNIGETELTNIHLTVIDDDSTDGVNANAESGNFNLAPKESKSMNITVLSLPAASDNAIFIISALDDASSSADSTLKVNLVPAEPVPRIEPGFIHTGANPGTSEIKTVKIRNTGYLTLENVSLGNPVNPWISIITDPDIGDIPPGGYKTFDIMINPGMDIAPGIYDDAVKITSDNYHDISFQVGVFVTSDKMGTLKFTVKSQFGDVLPNANVSIIDMETYTVALKNRTDPDGVAIFFGIPTGRYSYKVDAMYHDEVVGNVMVDVGTSTTTVPVTAIYNFLEVEWSVTPTTIKDVYTITHNVTYNTTVPIPYVKMDVVYDSLYMVPGAVYHGNVTLTNMNDIVTVSDGMPFARINNELVSVEFLVDEIPELKPHESITVPFVVKLATHHSPTPSPCDTYDIDIGYNFKNVHVCWLSDGTELTASVPTDTFHLSIKPTCLEAASNTASCILDLRTACKGSEVINGIQDVVSIVQGNLPGQSGACLDAATNCLTKTMSSVFAYGDCIDNFASCLGVPCSSCVSAVNSLAKCLFQENCYEEEDREIPLPYIPPAYVIITPTPTPTPTRTPYPKTTYKPDDGGGGWGIENWTCLDCGGGRVQPFTAAHCTHSPSSMCVKIQLEIKQELTLERQAFDAMLNLKNVQPDYDMTNISVNITFTNTSGGFSNNMFFTNLTELNGMRDANSGTIDAGATATMHWLIIPTPGAGGFTPSGEKYTVKATINYTVKGVEFGAETWPDTITVEPMPRLRLDYVLPHKILADNPETEGIIEPVVPFMFGVRVNNSGYGNANNLAIDSAQPVIVSSTEKTNINFRLLGTYVDGNEIKNTLKINFGNVQSKSCKAAGWIMMTTVSGYFSNYSATFKHADALGGEATSLMDSINTHTLIHEFINDQPGNDSMYDFIIDRDNDSIADSIMDSACIDEPITVVTAGGSNTPTVNNPVLNVTITGSAQGWGYMSLNDPMNNVYPILKIVRSDGKELSGYNYWMQENTIYFVDYNPSDKYRLVYKVPLLISNVNVTDMSVESARIKWDTDELSDGIVKYGTKSGVYTDQKKNMTDSMSQIINLNELIANTTYYYVVNSTHLSGNTNESAEFNFTTLELFDAIPPLSVSGLHNLTYSMTYINFTWLNPPDPDFSHVMLYLNNSFITNITAPQNYYNFTGLAPDTLYELGTHTVDSSGNVNETWVNATGRTLPPNVGNINFTLPLKIGWNMVSLPIIPDDLSVSAIFGSNVTTVYGWTGTSYVLRNELEPKMGYWVLSSSNYEITVTGTPVFDRNITLTGGWNMVGPVTNGIMISSLPNVTTVYGWTGTSYTILSSSDTLTLARGYWILANATSIIQV